MAAVFGVLLKRDFLSWLSVRGVILLLVAAAFPALLAGAWSVTHQADLSVESLTWDPDPVLENENVTFTAVITNKGRLSASGFNVTVGVGTVLGTGRIAPMEETTVRIDRLGAGKSEAVTLDWNGRFGLYVAYAIADVENEVAEINDFNNVFLDDFIVEHKPDPAERMPQPPGNLTGTPGAFVVGDAEVRGLEWSRQVIRTNQNVTIRATVVNHGPDPLINVSAHLEAGQNTTFGFVAFWSSEENMDLDVGEERTIVLEVASMTRGTYWARATVNVTDAQHDPVEENNHVAASFAVNPEAPGIIEPPDIPERLTIKQFYTTVLLFQFWIVIPFIALFFTAGVISSDRSSGNLTYILTRPVPRHFLVLSKFLAGLTMAAAAIVVANLVAYGILLGFTVEEDIGFLTTPLLASLIALFAYSCVFTLIGVLFDRPYVVGILYIIFWESLGVIDSILEMTGANLRLEVAAWVERGTIFFNILQAMGDWPLDEGFLLLPTTAEGVNLLRNIVLVSLGLLVLAVVVINRREFAD